MRLSVFWTLPLDSGADIHKVQMILEKPALFLANRLKYPCSARVMAHVPLATLSQIKVGVGAVESACVLVFQ